jgi:predicted ribosomally synthesized peptide with SipW-like signal peptide
MKRKTWFLSLAAVILVLSLSIGSAMAYFSAYATAQGGKTIQLGATTEISEPEISDWTKHVVITSQADSQPVYVRAKAFAGSEYTLTFESASGKWSQGDDGYYYYSDILEGGASTEELLIHIGGIPEDTKDFNVVVVYESTPVLYDADGNPYADWTQTIILNGAEGGQD